MNPNGPEWNGINRNEPERTGTYWDDNGITDNDRNIVRKNRTLSLQKNTFAGLRCVHIQYIHTEAFSREVVLQKQRHFG